ncbi:hypothetical protein [Salmonella phage ST46]|nr:hypothetical protein [Salmonella phage ST46]
MNGGKKMSIQMQLVLVLLIPAVVGFFVAVLWPQIRTWWYHEISRKREEWHK